MKIGCCNQGAELPFSDCLNPLHRGVSGRRRNGGDTGTAPEVFRGGVVVVAPGNVAVVSPDTMGFQCGATTAVAEALRDGMSQRSLMGGDWRPDKG